MNDPAPAFDSNSAPPSGLPVASQSTPPTVAIVMPAYNAATLVTTTVPAALAAAARAQGDCRMLVVDPGSSDDTAAVAESLGVDVLRLGRRAGPAEARNVGVSQIDADVVVFIDSDCVAHADVVERVQAAFAADPQLVGLTGSYDDTPPETNFASLYMNLRHHAVHQVAKREDASWWAGCGAVRVDVFRKIDGFDVEQFPMPMIEDIELGMRLRAQGNTRLDPELHVKHLKRWTVFSVIKTDIFCRAIPWSKLIHAAGDLQDDLNTKMSQRIAALVAPFALLAVPALAFTLWWNPIWAVIPAAALLLACVLNAPILGVFLRRKGLFFAIAAGLFHQVHLFYSAVTFVWVGLTHRGGSSTPSAVTA